jgi:O-antigen ligase
MKSELIGLDVKGKLPEGRRVDKTVLVGVLLAGAINYFFSDVIFFASTVAMLVLVISFDRTKPYTSSIRIFIPFAFLLLIGLLAGWRNTRIDFYRDIFIFSKNLFYFFAGVALSRFVRDIRDFFRLFLIVVFFSSLLHIGTFVMNFSSGLSLQQIRRAAGFTNGLEAIMVAFCVASFLNKRFRSVTGRLNKWGVIMFIVIGISFLLYFSRTMIVMAVVACIFFTNTIYIRNFFSKQNIRLLWVSLLFLSLIYIAYIGALFFPQNSPVRTLAEKFRNIPQEISWDSKKNLGATREEIQANWRGYEAYQGMQKYNKGNALQKTFGFGFGARVDLGLIMKLSGKDYETVPILHNEYVMLLVKSGIVGLILYLIFLYQIGFTSISAFESNNRELYFSYQILSALAVISVLNTYIGFGLLDTENASVPIFLGFFWGNIQRNIFEIKRASIMQNNMQIFRTQNM